MQNRHGKSRRFSGPGLGATENIPSGENQGDRLRLDWRCDGVTLGPNGVEDGRRQIES
jgi:hypothetical protein